MNMDFDWKKLVGTVAPVLGTALGGPLGGIAVKALGDALGLSDATEASLSQALSGATPDQLLALKKADQEFSVKMKELEVDVERIRYADIDSARKREVALQDKAVPRLASLVVVGFLGMVGMVLGGYAKVDTVLAGSLIGYVSGASTQVLAYYFGTSKSSSDKNQLLIAKK
jgi:hypothetical protein